MFIALVVSRIKAGDLWTANARRQPSVYARGLLQGKYLRDPTSRRSWSSLTNDSNFLAWYVYILRFIFDNVIAYFEVLRALVEIMR